jgi:hypothetical protein
MLLSSYRVATELSPTLNRRLKLARQPQIHNCRRNTMSRLKRRIWKVHPEFTDYEVSDLGQIRRRTSSPGTRIGKILKPSLSSKGYLYVSLKSKSKFVHRLVLETFVGPCPEGKECNHKDGVKSNPRLINLEWATSSQNQLHAYEIGLQKTPTLRKWIKKFIK